jgi:hypothetical protein
MADCPARATLIVTKTVTDTATNVARRRLVLSCSLTSGHAGPHRDAEQAEEWTALVDTTPTLVRHEDDD